MLQNVQIVAFKNSKNTSVFQKFHDDFIALQQFDQFIFLKIRLILCECA